MLQLKQLEARQEQLKEEIALEGADEPIPALHPNLAGLYRQKVEELQTARRDRSDSLHLVGWASAGGGLMRSIRN
jgi:hypothetical protein